VRMLCSVMPQKFCFRVKSGPQCFPAVKCYFWQAQYCEDGTLVRVLVDESAVVRHVWASALPPSEQRCSGMLNLLQHCEDDDTLEFPPHSIVAWDVRALAV
jgi:hypothetical protein